MMSVLDRPEGHSCRRAARERAREGEEEREAKGVDIRTSIAPAPHDDLRGNVVERPDEGPRLRQGRLAFDPRRSEVREVTPPVRPQQNILWLDVPVKDPAPVCREEGARDLA